MPAVSRRNRKKIAEQVCLEAKHANIREARRLEHEAYLAERYWQKHIRPAREAATEWRPRDEVAMVVEVA